MEVLPPADQLMKNVRCQGIGMLRPLEVASVTYLLADCPCDIVWRTRSDDIGLDQLLSHASIDVEV